MLIYKSELTSVHFKDADEQNIQIDMLRLDKIHEDISGNKWFKLKYNIEEFLVQKKEYMVTFGGAYSNHIIATAAAGKEFGIKTIKSDLSDSDNVKNIVANFDLVVGAVPGFMGYNTVKSVIEAGFG